MLNSTFLRMAQNEGIWSTILIGKLIMRGKATFFYTLSPHANVFSLPKYIKMIRYEVSGFLTDFWAVLPCVTFQQPLLIISGHLETCSALPSPAENTIQIQK